MGGASRSHARLYSGLAVPKKDRRLTERYRDNVTHFHAGQRSMISYRRLYRIWNIADECMPGPVQIVDLYPSPRTRRIRLLRVAPTPMSRGYDRLGQILRANLGRSGLGSSPPIVQNSHVFEGR